MAQHSAHGAETMTEHHGTHSIGKGDVGGSIPPSSTINTSDLASGKGALTGSDEPVNPYTWLEQARLWSKVNIPECPRDTDLCWPWKGSLAKGYGQIKLKGRGVLRAHRVACEIAHGSAPSADMQALHCAGAHAQRTWRSAKNAVAFGMAAHGGRRRHEVDSSILSSSTTLP